MDFLFGLVPFYPGTRLGVGDGILESLVWVWGLGAQSGQQFALHMSAPGLELASGLGKPLALEPRGLVPNSDYGRGVVTLCWSVIEKVVCEPRAEVDVSAFHWFLISASGSLSLSSHRETEVCPGPYNGLDTKLGME